MVIVRLADYPLCVRGFTMKDEEGTYNVYINSRYSYAQQQKTLKHELTHIQNDDFEKDLPGSLIERVS